jgi:diacylglycerol kinase family enzyme
MAIATTGSLYAGRFPIAPAARLGEPVVHLVLLQGGGRRAVMRYGAALLVRRLPKTKGVVIIAARTVIIAGADGAPVQADGDIVAHLPIAIAVADRPIPLIGPEGGRF